VREFNNVCVCSVGGTAAGAAETLVWLRAGTLNLASTPACHTAVYLIRAKVSCDEERTEPIVTHVSDLSIIWILGNCRHQYGSQYSNDRLLG
jgi:hypothetical protein